jgi:V8-like Glu-specific endopeptidase
LIFADKDGLAACSGTPIAPDAILTATHCEEPVKDADGVVHYGTLIRVAGNTITVRRVERDGNDHSIFYLSASVFKTYGHVKVRHIEVGEHLTAHGYPGLLNGGLMYHEYLVMGVGDVNGTVFIALSGQSWPGDSGSAVFDKNGDIVGVVSVGDKGITGLYPLTGYWAVYE